jgi:hypothetical protein
MFKTFILCAASSLLATAAEPQVRAPIYLFWDGIDDNYTTPNTTGALSGGYRQIRVEGHILKNAWFGAVPLKQYFHSGNLYTYDARNMQLVATFPWHGGGLSGPVIGKGGRVYAIAKSGPYDAMYAFPGSTAPWADDNASTSCDVLAPAS